MSDSELLVISVHAILLESGFAGLDMASGSRVDRIRIPNQWPSTNSAMSLWYTLPELFNHSSDNLPECFVLKFHCIGDLVNVYGSVVEDDLGLHKVSLNKNKLAPIIGSMWANSDRKDKVDDPDGFKNSYPENEMFEFWKMVKDGLALPLLIDLCERAGLNLPVCLMRLPTELMQEVGRVASPVVPPTISKWKDRFAMMHWEMNKRRKMGNAIHPPPHIARLILYPRRDPYPFWFPLIRGDADYMVHEPFGLLDRPFARAGARSQGGGIFRLSVGGGFNAIVLEVRVLHQIVVEVYHK